jgi:predicted kinase
MEMIIFIGIQGAGKSTFYQRRFFGTHVRLNLDMLKTRHRLKLLMEACFLAKQRFVIDNTNVSREERMAHIEQAKAAGFSVVGYYFEPAVERSLEWNATRSGKAQIPVKGVLGTLKRLEKPHADEGFDSLLNVVINEQGDYVIQEWPAQP